MPDYGLLGQEEWFVVKERRENEALVYSAERFGCRFSWALVLMETNLRETEVGAGGREGVGGDGDGMWKGGGETIEALRSRGSIESTTWKRRVLGWGGEKIDYWTTRPMLLGLKERVDLRKVD